MSFLLVFLAMLVQQSNNGHRVFKQDNIVMGYTDARVSVSNQDLPPALLDWMQWSGTTEALTTSNDHVDPLLWTEWDQDYPYNAMCPEYKAGKTSATGCVATAMAQVMAYWRYPADAYDWDNMLPNYGNLQGQQATQQQRNAVAQLMVDCGMSIDMEYGESSSASTYMVPVALAGLYGYNRGAHYVYRKQNNYEEWAELMRNELRNGRPIIYRGSSSSVGHCFVIDGFNEEGFFHVNWGWEGHSNGWYRFTMLTPPNLGIGGGSSSDGYNINQGMLIGVAPATILSTPVEYKLTADSLTLHKNQQGRDSIDIKGYANRSSGDTLSGDLGVALYQNGTMLRVLKYSSFLRPVDNEMIRHVNNVDINGLTPGETYQLIAVWRDPVHAPEWQMLESIDHAPCGRTLYATSANTFTHTRIDNQGHPVCQSIETGLMAIGHPTTLKTVWSTDSSEWTGRVTMALDNGTDFQFIAYSGMDLKANRQDTLSLYSMPINVPEGIYNLRVGYYDGNSLRWLDNSWTVGVLSMPTADIVYPVTNSFVFSDTIFSSQNPQLKMDVRMTLPSKSAPLTVFSGLITIGIYDANDKLQLTPATPVRVLMIKGDTATLHFEGNVGDFLPNGRYCVLVRVRETGESAYTRLTNSLYRNYITIDDSYTAIETPYIRPERAYKILRNGQIVIVSQGNMYDLMGRLIEPLTDTDIL